MIDNKRKIVVKTIRIPNDLNIFLNDQAKTSNVTPSTLISTIFTLHKERYRHFEKLKPVALYPAILASFVDLVSEEDLTKLGRIEASQLIDYANYALNQEDPQDLVNYVLVNLMPTSQWFTCIRSKDAYMITHQMGEKWTVFLLSLLSSFIEMKTSKKPSIKSEGDIIILELT